MFFYLSKILSYFLFPSTWIMLLILWAWRTKKVKRKKYLYISSVLLFFFFSNRFLTDEFVRYWEYPTVSLQQINSRYDAVIILGGYTTFNNKNNLTEFHESVDRILYGLYFYKQGIAEKIIISGGNARLIDDKEESVITKEYLAGIGVLRSDILTEKKSRNTNENAKYVAELLKEKNISGKLLLITSAYHMRRAEKCFLKQNLHVTVFPVDYISGPRKYYLDHLLLPNLECFLIWQTLIHEWAGYLIYKTLSYI